MNNKIEFHWTKTQRGAPAIQIENDLYRIQKRNSNGTLRFTCTNERCNASITLFENKIQAIRGVHHHQERVLPFHIGQVVNEFRQAAVVDLKTPLPQIYDHIAKKFRREYGTAADLPMFQQLKSTGYRTRATAIPPCPKRTDIRQFELPQAFCINSSDEPFLIHDSADPHRLIVFASKKSLNYLASCLAIHSDGTFHTAPRHFAQSYTIHGWCADTGMKAVCYAATEKKFTKIYKTLFQALKDAASTIGINLAPSSHMMDFEPAAAKASKAVFDGIKISFCHFHLAKAIWKKIQKKGLVSLTHETNIRRCIADLIALPLLPIDVVRERFEIISRQLRSENSLFNPFITYFRRTYIKSTKFPIHSWNHYDYLGTRPRTNNHVEGSHRHLKTQIRAKPNIWLWILSIQELDESTTIAIEQEEHQQRSTRPRHRRYIQRDEDLLNLKIKLENHTIDIEEYCFELRYTSYSYLKKLDI